MSKALQIAGRSTLVWAGLLLVALALAACWPNTARAQVIVQFGPPVVGPRVVIPPPIYPPYIYAPRVYYTPRIYTYSPYPYYARPLSPRYYVPPPRYRR